MATPRQKNKPKQSYGFQPVHGEARKTKEYWIWASIKSRCYGKNQKTFSDYGGRGITVCDRWRDSYPNFLADMGRAPSPKHSIDRINNNGNYEPGNCRWATKIQQANNTRVNRMIEYRGQIKTLSEWCRELNINRGTVESRLDRQKWTVPQAFETPTRLRLSPISK